MDPCNSFWCKSHIKIFRQLTAPLSPFLPLKVTLTTDNICGCSRRKTNTWPSRRKRANWRDKPNSPDPEEALLSYPARLCWRGSLSSPTQAHGSPERFHYLPSSKGRKKEAALLFHNNWMKKSGWEYNSFQSLMNYLPIKEMSQARGGLHNFDMNVPYIIYTHEIVAFIN